jgi:hypothetical protein
MRDKIQGGNKWTNNIMNGTGRSTAGLNGMLNTSLRG